MSRVTVLSSAKMVFFGILYSIRETKNAHQSFGRGRLSQAGRLGGEIQMIIKYTKIAIFFEGALIDSINCSGLITPIMIDFQLKGCEVAGWVVRVSWWRLKG